MLNNRVEQLDSMRGLAALAVVIGHAIYVTTPTIPTILDYTPLHLLWGGHEAVIFFFVLSGFVLSLPFFSGKEMPYKSYILKRFCRIYIPYVAAILVTFLLCSLTSRGGIAELGAWFNEKWTSPITYDVLIQHLLLLGDFPTTNFNPVIWSLVHEMRISLFFPLIVIMVAKWGWRKSIAVALVLSTVSFAEGMLNIEQQQGFKTGFIDSLHFTSMFIIGAVLAKHRQEIVLLYHKLKRANVSVLLGSAILLMTYSRGTRVLPFPNDAMDVIADWAIMCGVVIFIVIAISSGTVANVLRHRILLFNGKVSYSLYLFHAIVLFAMFNLFYGVIPTWIIYFISAVGIMLLTVIAHYAVEKPSIGLGRQLSKVSTSTKTVFSLNKSGGEL